MYAVGLDDLDVGQRLDSPVSRAHRRAISLGVVAGALLVGLGLQIADPIIGLVISLVILRITWQSWRTVRRTRATTTADAGAGYRLGTNLSAPEDNREELRARQEPNHRCGSSPGQATEPKVQRFESSRAR